MIYLNVCTETRRPFSRMSATRKALPMASVSAVSLGGEQPGQTTARVSSSPALATVRTGENPASQYGKRFSAALLVLLKKSRF